MLADLPWYIIPAAYILDMILGDPNYIFYRFIPHPIIVMGKAIETFETFFRKQVKNEFAAGLCLAVFLILTAWASTWFLIKGCEIISPYLATAVQVVILFFCFSTRTLEKAAMQVVYALEKQGLIEARNKLAMIVGRQTSRLDETGVSRAACETVAENFVDGFLSPLFFVLIAGVPGAVAYKMINTLDSMIGYKNEQYAKFGKAAARIDDAANYIPARISVFIISLAAGMLNIARARKSFQTGFKEGRQHKSPNAGFPEAAFAGALEIRLGGPSYYFDNLVEKPFIGKHFKDPKPNSIKMACDLMLLSSFISTLLACFICLIF